MNVLVAVASKHGSTHEIGESIADELRSANIAVDLKQPDEVMTLAPYDAIILGSGIYAGNWLPEAKGFAERFRAELAALPVWVFSSGPLGTDNPQPHDDPQKLAAPLNGIAIRDHQIFVGKLERSNLGLAERMIAKVVGAPEGDFRHWNVIRAWARDIATTLTASIPA